MSIKNIVKNNAARFSFYRAGYMDYDIGVDRQPVPGQPWKTWEQPPY